MFNYIRAISEQNNLKEYTIGITGGSGYLGSSLAKRLCGSFDVTLLDIKEIKEQLPENVSFQNCDIREYNQVKNAVENVDLVIHTAIIQIPVISEQKKLGYEVNILGTQNVCKAVNEASRPKGLILSGSWHTIGERELKGVIDEEFGFRPDKVEDRARLYALAKIAQESIVRFYDEMTDKVFGIIRMGTVLGEGMPEKTAANMFINKGLMGKPITPYKHSMYRPMLYVDIEDVCSGYKKFAEKILKHEVDIDTNSLAHIFNIYYPKPITILKLAEIIREAIIMFSKNKIKPEIEIVDVKQPNLFENRDSRQISVDIFKALNYLQLGKIKTPKESIEEMIRKKLKSEKE